MLIQLQVGVKALIRNEEGAYLMLLRSTIKYPEVQNRWDIPGGRIEAGVPLLDNLQREITEETTLTISDTPILLAAQDILRIEGRHVVRLTYMCHAIGSVTLDRTEHERFDWMSYAQIITLEELDPYLKDILPLLNKEE